MVRIERDLRNDYRRGRVKKKIQYAPEVKKIKRKKFHPSHPADRWYTTSATRVTTMTLRAFGQRVPIEKSLGEIFRGSLRNENENNFE